MQIARFASIVAIAALLFAGSARAADPVFEKDIEFANPDNQHLQLNLARPAEDEATGKLTSQLEVHQRGLAAAKTAGLDPEAAQIQKEIDDLKTQLGKLPHATFPAVLCIHGGGFRAGKREKWDSMCKELAGRGFVAVTITYRLAPKYQFPAAIEDCKAAVRWLRLNAATYHIDPNRIGVMGDSAGGHLTQFLAVTGNVHDFDGDQNPGPSSAVQCAVSYYGPCDFTRSYGKSVDAAEVLPLFLGGDLTTARHKHILASPLYWATPACPPILLMQGDQDKFVNYEQAVMMNERLKAAEVDVELLTLPGAGHGFKGDDLKKANTAAVEFLVKHLQAK